MVDFKALAAQYKSELLDRVIPFWLEKSQDTEFGGYFTCLDRDGSVYDTDKFIWMQGREVWMFSKLYNEVEHRQEWLDCAIQGAEFLKKYGHDGHYNWYFAVDREGRALVEPYNIFSYTFAVIAFGQLALATGNREYADIAKRTFDIVLSKVDNPKGRWNKAVPGSRALKSLSVLFKAGVFDRGGNVVELGVESRDSGILLFDDVFNQSVKCHFLPPQIMRTAQLITAGAKLFSLNSL